MKLQFKVQQYQTDAVNAIVDCFAGQPKHDGLSYRIDPGRLKPGPGARADPRIPDSGLRNAEIALTPAQLLENVHAVQTRRGLPLSTKLVDSKAAPGAPNLDIEMETGTGKTYVYIKTMMELHQRYGWSKFIVVVPSVAIREGVKKSFDITAEHFQQMYGTKPRSFIYNSSQLHELERFSSDAGVQVMIINIQAFNSTGKDNRRIYDVLDDFQSRRPIDVIRANRPIVIIDEPQKIGAAQVARSRSRKFNALMVLRYSATHKVEHTKVHRLDALDAYNQKLVKHIAVRGITVKGLAGTTAYLYLDGIEMPRAQPASPGRDRGADQGWPDQAAGEARRQGRQASTTSPMASRRTRTCSSPMSTPTATSSNSATGMSSSPGSSPTATSPKSRSAASRSARSSAPTSTRSASSSPRASRCCRCSSSTRWRSTATTTARTRSATTPAMFEEEYRLP